MNRDIPTIPHHIFSTFNTSCRIVLIGNDIVSVSRDHAVLKDAAEKLTIDTVQGKGMLILMKDQRLSFSGLCLCCN